MNNAANNIEANSKTLRDLLKERRYNVGFFQREYRWQKTHIEELLDDLERSFFSNYSIDHTQEDIANYNCYYMGPIVLFREGSAFSIIDGQQRLTSFTLLIIYLIHLQKEAYKTDPNKQQKLKEYIYSKIFGKESFNLNIKDRDAIVEKLYRNHDVETQDLVNESCINLYYRYRDIEELFPPRLKHQSTLAMFINWITEKLVFVEITAQTDESAYTIFETMNDRGLNLTPSEMLKSFLLASIKDEEKIRELEAGWKLKIGMLKGYSNEGDQDFFKAWLRSKFAETIRSSKDGSENEDFEKIGTRFHNWVQSNTLKLQLKKPDDYYFLVESDFHFYSDLFLKLNELESSDALPEHSFKLISYKGVSSSLSYPLILSTIQKIDDDLIIEDKLNLSIRFLDCFGIYRLLLGQSISQSTIRYTIYNLIKQIRDKNIDDLTSILRENIFELRTKFIKDLDYIPFDKNYSKYLFARLLKLRHDQLPFEILYYRRRKDSYKLVKLVTPFDTEDSVRRLPYKLKEIIMNSLCSSCLVPAEIGREISLLTVVDRIQLLFNKGYLPEYSINPFHNNDDLQNFFINRNKLLKVIILKNWKV